MRIIVTGSRAFPERGPVWDRLSALREQYGTFVLVHGGCSTGADAYASVWAAAHPEIAEEIFKADWQNQGKRAGPIRNRRMVDSGADMVLAFPLPQGSGTQMTIDLARKAGIFTEIWRPANG